MYRPDAGQCVGIYEAEKERDHAGREHPDPGCVPLRVKSAAARSGFSNVTKPATMYSAPRRSQKRNLPHDFIRNALMTSAIVRYQHHDAD
jgi:hypothetical protein